MFSAVRISSAELNTEWDICFVYNGATLTWINSVNNFRFFINISKTLQLTNIHYILLERSFNRASAGICCIKIHAEIAEKLQDKDRGFIFTGAPVYMKVFFTFFF